MRVVVGAAGQGYMPWQRDRTPESSLKGGPAKVEGIVRAVVEYDSR